MIPTDTSKITHLLSPAMNTQKSQKQHNLTKTYHFYKQKLLKMILLTIHLLPLFVLIDTQKNS